MILVQVWLRITLFDETAATFRDFAKDPLGDVVLFTPFGGLGVFSFSLKAQASISFVSRMLVRSCSTACVRRKAKAINMKNT